MTTSNTGLRPQPITMLTENVSVSGLVTITTTDKRDQDGVLLERWVTFKTDTFWSTPVNLRWAPKSYRHGAPLVPSVNWSAGGVNSDATPSQIAQDFATMWAIVNGSIEEGIESSQREYNEAADKKRSSESTDSEIMKLIEKVAAASGLVMVNVDDAAAGLRQIKSIMRYRGLLDDECDDD